MRWLLTTVTLALAGPAFAQDNEAEKLYRAMEKQVRSAKSLKVVFELTADFGKEAAKTKGFLTAAEGNKGRVELQTKLPGGSEVAVQMIADGKKTATISDGKVQGQPQPVEPSLTEAALALTARGGIFAVLETNPDPKTNFDVDKVMPATDFKLGNKEQVGNREAQVLTYNLKPPMRDPVQVTLWLDTKLNLPLKRTLAGAAKGGKINVTETYTEFTLNPSLDAKMFELPK